MLAFTITILAIAVLVGVGTWLYLRFDAAKQSGEAVPKVTLRTGNKKQITVKNIWGIEDIKRGVLILEGNGYCVVCRVSAADFWLLADFEQDDVEDAATAAMRQISFPVQCLVTSQVLDTRAAVEELRQGADRLPGMLKEMANARADYLNAIAREKAASARQAYLVIPYDTVQGYDHALRELQARVVNLASALTSAKVSVEVLSSDAAVDLLGHLINRGRTWRPSDAVRNGAMSFYHVSERSIAVNG